MNEKIKTVDVAAALEKTRGLERDYTAELISSRRWAWRVAGLAGLLALVSVGAVVGLTPLKQPPEMYVVRVDDATGAIEHVSTLGEPLDQYGERIDKYFLNSFVRNCEGYNWYTIQEQFDTCALLSAQPIQTQYGKRYEGPNAPTERLGTQGNIDVSVHSITLGANNSATVRFTTTEREASTGRADNERHLIATMAYHYVNVPLSESVMRRNPLGFQVIRYDLAADLSR